MPTPPPKNGPIIPPMASNTVAKLVLLCFLSLLVAYLTWSVTTVTVKTTFWGKPSSTSKVSKASTLRVSSSKEWFESGMHSTIGEQPSMEVPDVTNVTDPFEVHRRSLAIVSDHCPIRVKFYQSQQQIQQLPPIASPIYLATFPGCGSRLTRNLIEALTGYSTADDWDPTIQNGGSGGGRQYNQDIIAIESHYPQMEPQPQIDQVPYALLMLRNPMDAMTKVFEYKYEMKKHRVPHQQAQQTQQQQQQQSNGGGSPDDEYMQAWIQWRDKSLTKYLDAFQQFVRYWMNHYTIDSANVHSQNNLQVPPKLLVISYEDVMSDYGGIDEAGRLMRFLATVLNIEQHQIHTEQSSESSNNIFQHVLQDGESLACVWRKIVKFKKPKIQWTFVVDGVEVQQDDTYRADEMDSITPDRPPIEDILQGEILGRRGRRRRLKRGYYIYHPLDKENSIGAVGGKNDNRSFTTEQLEFVANLLEELAVEYQNHNNHLYGLLRRYHKEVMEVLLPNENWGDGSSLENDEDHRSQQLQHQHGQDRRNVPIQQNVALDSIPSHSFFDTPSFGEFGASPNLKSSNGQYRGGSNTNPQYGSQHMEFQGQSPSKLAGTTLDGRTFHIIQASPPNTGSEILTEWLVGLFEPSGDYTYLAGAPRMALYQHSTGKNVPVMEITGSVVTQTQHTSLLELYKLFKPHFNEVFFVSSNRGVDQRLDGDLCDYDNVLCFEYEELLYNTEEDLPAVVRYLTHKFQSRFSYFFSASGRAVWMDEDKAVLRLKEMDGDSKPLQNELQKDEVKENGQGKIGSEQIFWTGGKWMGVQSEEEGKEGGASPLHRRLFYCGATGPKGKEHDSLYGIFLVNAFFPEIEGAAPGNDANKKVATKLTASTLEDATSNDFLVYHMFQRCDVDPLKFPGLQLHVNAEYYDMHPNDVRNIDSKFTLDYIPPGENVFVIGPHEDSAHSIRLPYAMMKWFVLAKGSHSVINSSVTEKFFDHTKKPKNSKLHFLLYANSHYVEYREVAAKALSSIRPIHAVGKCQGNLSLGPKIEGTKPPQCQPFEQGTRPSSIIVPENENNHIMAKNRKTFEDYRFVLLMENTNVPGYITEKIIDGFMAGTIPIYYGTTDVFDIFNRRAFIYYDVENPQEAIDRITFLENNQEAYDRVLNEPILADGKNTIEKYFSFEDYIGHGKLKKRVREKIGFLS